MVPHADYRPTAESLYCDTINLGSVDFDWTEPARLDEDGEERWKWWETAECPHCKRMIVADCGLFVTHFATIRDSAEGNECPGSGEYSDSAEGPMMGYYYVLPHFSIEEEDAAERISDLPLCVVRFADGTTALALTGGGMDLRWEICDAYIRLGYLPPLHFAGELPNMGRIRAEVAARVLPAALRSARIAGEWAVRAAERICDQAAIQYGPANMANVPADEMRLAVRLANAGRKGAE